MAGFLSRFRKPRPGAAPPPQPPPGQVDAWTALAGTDARPAAPPPEAPAAAVAPPVVEETAEADFAFDEEWYLHKYPDVGAAVRRLPHTSARDHYITHGRREGRLPLPPPDWDRSAALAMARPTVARHDDAAIGAKSGATDRSGP